MGKKEASSSPPRKNRNIYIYTRRRHPVGPQQFHLIGPNSVLSLEKEREREREREAESDVFVRLGFRAKFLALTTLFSCIASQLSSIVYIDRGPKERNLSPHSDPACFQISPVSPSAGHLVRQRSTARVCCCVVIAVTQQCIREVAHHHANVSFRLCLSLDVISWSRVLRARQLLYYHTACTKEKQWTREKEKTVQ